MIVPEPFLRRGTKVTELMTYLGVLRYYSCTKYRECEVLQMKDLGCRIWGFRISELNSRIGESGGDFQQLRVQNRVAGKSLIDPTAKECMLQVETKIWTAKSGGPSININSEIIFDFDEVPEDYKQIIEDVCYPMAWSRIKEAVRDITSAMGIEPLDLDELE